jgi:uncharacterized protein (TIGR02679 family)
VIPPGLERVVERAAARRERRGQFGDAKVALDPLTPQEADALDGLPWPGRRRPFLSGETRTIGLLRFEASLEAAGLPPTALYEEALGRPLRDLPAEGRARRAARDAFRQGIVDDPRVAERPALRAWLESARSSGRLGARDADLLAEALRVVERLPAERPVDRAVLAADLFDGRPHALDADKPLGRLTRSMLAACHGIDDDARARAAWSAAGVEVDPTSATVLTLGLAPFGDEPIEVALRAQLGRHVVLTLGQLSGVAARWTGGDVFVCENPSVLRAAERALGERSAPLVCGSGWPTDAVRLLLEQLRSAGATIRYHGDFDLTGVAIFRLLEREIRVRPWRYDAAAYAAALTACADRDLPRADAAAADAAGDLEAALASHDREVPEELVIDELLLDLATAGSSAQRARLHDPVAGRG